MVSLTPLSNHYVLCPVHDCITTVLILKRVPSGVELGINGRVVNSWCARSPMLVHAFMHRLVGFTYIWMSPHKHCFCIEATYQKLTTQELRKSLKDSRHVTIQLRHGSVNWKKITQPEEASRMRCHVAIKNSKSRRPELFDQFCLFTCNWIFKHFQKIVHVVNCQENY